jgi:transposase
MIRYRVKLSKEEVEELTKIINKGSHSTQAFKAACILLNSDEGNYSLGKMTNEKVSKVLKISMKTIDRVKKRFIEEGLDSVLNRRPSSRVYDKKIDGEAEAKLVSLCCSVPPEGFAKWSLRLLADTMVELQYVESISHVSVGKVLKKTNCSLGKLKNG